MPQFRKCYESFRLKDGILFHAPWSSVSRGSPKWSFLPPLTNINKTLYVIQGLLNAHTKHCREMQGHRHFLKTVSRVSKF